MEIECNGCGLSDLQFFPMYLGDSEGKVLCIPIGLEMHGMTEWEAIPYVCNSCGSKGTQMVLGKNLQEVLKSLEPLPV